MSEWGNAGRLPHKVKVLACMRSGNYARMRGLVKVLELLKINDIWSHIAYLGLYIGNLD